MLTAGLAGLFFCWVAASPIGSVPDEYQHYKWGYALWTGQVHAGSTTYEVPLLFTSNRISCYAFQPQVSAGCNTDGQHDGVERLVSAETSANFYPPAFYALTGWTLRLFPNDTGVYLGRLVGAAVCAALLAASLALLRSVGWRAASFGLLFCVSPMLAFFAGGYNPQGLELAIVTALVTSALVTFHVDRSHSAIRFATALLCASLVALPLVRPLGWLWSLLLLALVALTAGIPRRGEVREPDRGVSTLRSTSRAVWISLLVGMIVGYTWGRLGSTIGSSGPAAADQRIVLLKRVLLYLLDRMQEFPLEWLGVTGSLDTFPPAPATAIWYGALGVLVTIGLACARRWWIASVLASVAGIVVATVYTEFRAEAAGSTLAQGRYVLPLVFVVILAASAAWDLAPPAVPVRAFSLLAGAWAATHVALLAQSLRRNIYGFPGLPWTAPAAWQPPVFAAAILLASLATAVWVAVVVRRWSRAEPSSLATRAALDAG